MLGFGRAFGAVVGAVALGAGAVVGAPFAREAGLLPPLGENPSQSAAPELAPVGTEAGPYASFASLREGLINRVSHVNALCGFNETLEAGGRVLQLTGEAPGYFSILRAGNSEARLVERFGASADRLHAFARNGELYVQLADGRFSARNFVLSQSGEPENSFPLFAAARHVMMCDDASAAAQALNVVFEGDGASVDTVRAGVRAFAVGGAFDERDTVTALVEACTPSEVLAELPEGRRILIGARLNRDGYYGEDVVHDMSGESLAGQPTPMLDIQIARIAPGSGIADIESHGVPATDWSFLPSTTSGFGPFFRYSAVERYDFTIDGDGARSHSFQAGLDDGVDIPCANVEEGRAALEALRASLMQDAP